MFYKILKISFLCLALAACGGGGDGTTAAPTPAPCVLTAGGVSAVTNITTPLGVSCLLTVSGIGNVVNIAADSVFSDVTISGSNHLVTFGDGSRVDGWFLISGNDSTITSQAVDNLVIDADSGSGNSHIEL